MIEKIYTEQSSEPDIFTTDFLHSSASSSKQSNASSDRSLSASPKNSSTSSSASPSKGKKSASQSPKKQQQQQQQQQPNVLPNGLVITKTSPLVAAELSLDEREELMELTGNNSIGDSKPPSHFTSLIDEKTNLNKHQIFKQIQETMDILKQDLLNKSRSSEFSDASVCTNKQDEIDRLKLDQEMMQRERDLIEEEKERLRLEAERLRIEREMILAANPKYPVSHSTNLDTTYLVMSDSNMDPSVNYTNLGLHQTKMPTTPQKVILKKPISPPPVVSMQQQQRKNSNMPMHIGQHQSPSHMLCSMDQNLRLSVPNLILDQQQGGCQQQLPVAAQTSSPYKTSSGNQNKQYQPNGNTARIYQTSNSRSHKLIGNFY